MTGIHIRRPYTHDGGREMLIFTNGASRFIRLDFENASALGTYLNAVRRLLLNNDPSELLEWEGVRIFDIYGRGYELEVRPNVLYRITSSGESYLEVYRFVSH